MKTLFLILLTLPAWCQLPRPVYDCDNVANFYYAKFMRVDTLLRLTRAKADTLLIEKEDRIRRLELAANSRIRDEGAKLGETRAKLASLINGLKDEGLRGRFLGFGRRRAIRAILKGVE